ncbi:hypothetical protein L210DRAFT_3643404 [Boletus edulis BED1]|uniref:phosphoribosylglycinamide formyltransferase 1 n=1 Tax=Boletus edulis BED1 TaxID=1328754 RepID=A0AAD4BZ75_BOLED|nr:hypothetical protein L210DRAFT_3643404 [Boletus edulis BED1]
MEQFMVDNVIFNSPHCSSAVHPRSHVRYEPPEALIDACNTPRLPHVQIVLVLSNRKAAYGLTRATTANPPIPTVYLGLPPFLRDNPGATRVEYDLAVAREAPEVRPDVLVLAGWMHIVSEGFLEAMRGVRAIPLSSSHTPESKGKDDHGLGVTRDTPVINIHPALPSQFDGANVMEQVDRGAPITVREVELHKGKDLKNGGCIALSGRSSIIVEAAKEVLDEVRPVGDC